ncbi:hypothetical protein B0H67DRAFT_644977 [Lasiosphaeris hirsuta]|uniref:Uncharacterized protein n=1 Tax=Lasiosphaeris hirsuta TaxID=260670 RepID=A0AA40AG24_9PEZI|nr:hypothetical protein B0H67DRAFT_644977 [Lasiosphaeris hirsuta]
MLLSHSLGAITGLMALATTPISATPVSVDPVSAAEAHPAIKLRDPAPVPSTPKDWWLGLGTTIFYGGVDMGEACVWQYGNFGWYCAQRGTGAFDWYCKINGLNLEMSIDVDAYCRRKYDPRAWGNFGNGGQYDWQCMAHF